MNPPQEQRHVTFNVRGVRVTFPFEPYELQREYCASVIEAIQKQQNAILESPTGTGKTLSLLTSSLAWQQAASEQSKMIFYLSRTHLQLSQAAKEMKKTAYARVPSVVLASRTHMCLNKEVLDQAQGTDINRACQNAIAKNACTYFSNYEDKLKANIDFNKVHDIEDLHKFGHKNQCCPFYASKKIAETQAALVFMPYNYILDLSVRKSIQIKLDKSVLIIDEGHNIESSLKESASASFSKMSLKAVVESCEKLPQELNKAMMRDLHGLTRRGFEPDKVKRKTVITEEFSTKNTTSSKKKQSEKENKPNPIEELSEKLTTDKLQQIRRCAQELDRCKDLLATSQGQYIETRCDIGTVLNQLKEAGVEFSTSDAIITTLESMSTFWSIVGVVNTQMVSRFVAATASLCHFISLIFPQGIMSKLKFDMHIESLKKHYSAYMLVDLEKETILVKSNKLLNWTMNLWCLNPGIGLKRVIDDSCLAGPRSIIITSGTLSPMEPIARELEKEFKIIKEFDHLIKDNQMKIAILSESPNRYTLDTTYKSTSNSNCLIAIGESIGALLRVLPFGTLVFFPSYRLMKTVLSYCESKPFWISMQKTTHIFKESSNQSSFTGDMHQFKKIVDGNGRAVFMGVCRGKLSEGTNLEQNHCRSVIIVGLPYPHRGDPQVKETLAFQARRGDLNGNTWYTNQMRRALGQAMGRVIRSRDDFGMVFLVDSRFPLYKLTVSKWIQKYYPNYVTNDYTLLANEVKEFFAQHDVDISLMNMATSASQMGQGAFEFANPTRRVANGIQAPSNTATSSQSRGLGSEIQSDLSGQGKSVSDDITEAPRSFEDRQAEMRRAYTVDRATYQKAQEKARKDLDAERAPATKKIKTVGDVADRIFSETTHDLNGTPAASAPAAPAPAKPTNIFKRQKPPAKRPKESLPKKEQAILQCHVCFETASENRDLLKKNCKCPDVAHMNCIKHLNNKECAKCGVVLKKKEWKEATLFVATFTTQ